MNAEWVSCRINQAWAVDCSQLPVTETSCPPKNSR